MNFSPFWGAHWQAGGYCSITAAKWILHNDFNTMNTGWNNECSINSFEEDKFCFWSLLLSVVCQYAKYWTQKLLTIFFSFPLTFALPENPNIDQLAFVELKQLTHSFPRREKKKRYKVLLTGVDELIAHGSRANGWKRGMQNPATCRAFPCANSCKPFLHFNKVSE